jgi:hypothetical protein
VDPRAGLDNVEKRTVLDLPGLEPRPLSRPARSQSLYIDKEILMMGTFAFFFFLLLCFTVFHSLYLIILERRSHRLLLRLRLLCFVR